MLLFFGLTELTYELFRLLYPFEYFGWLVFGLYKVGKTKARNFFFVNFTFWVFDGGNKVKSFSCKLLRLVIKCEFLLKNVSIHEHKVHPELFIFTINNTIISICIEHHKSQFAFFFFRSVICNILMNKIIVNHN